MNSTAVVLKLTLPFSSSCYHATVSSSYNELRTSSKSVAVERRRSTIEIRSSEVREDQGHLQYYKPKNHGSSSSAAAAGMMTVRSGKQEKAAKDGSPKKMKKKQMKLLKGLTRDLSTFSQMGFGPESDGALVDQVKGNMISEAVELLLERLQKIRADEKELKRKKKEEKERLQASRVRTTDIDCEVSSGSSSESSNSECGEVLDMKDLEPTQAKQNDLQEAMVEATLPALPGTSVPEQRMNLQLKSSCNMESECCSGAVIACARTDPSSLPNPTCSKKIEVCMGGKCRKSGAAALLEEFQEAVGIEGAVSGCKCMGKCRDGPNVKVLNGFGGDDDNSLGISPRRSLCIGVGLEDVKLIVASLIGQDHNQLGFAAAS